MEEVNATQQRVIVDLVKEFHGLIDDAKSISIKTRNFWKYLTETLNSKGPPIKTVPKWKQVWMAQRKLLRMKKPCERTSFRQRNTRSSTSISSTSNEQEILNIYNKDALPTQVQGANPNSKKSAKYEATNNISKPKLKMTNRNPTIDVPENRNNTKNIPLSNELELKRHFFTQINQKMEELVKLVKEKNILQKIAMERDKKYREKKLSMIRKYRGQVLKI